MSVDVFLVRHGQTVANISKVLSGWTETELTETGVEQARNAGRVLAEQISDAQGFSDHGEIHVLASDLSRAQHTARVIGQQLGTDQVVVVPQLREWNFGAFEGKPQIHMWRAILDHLGIWVDPGYLEKATYWDNVSLLENHGYGEADMMDALAALDPSGATDGWNHYAQRLHGAVDVISETAQNLEGNGTVVAVAHGAVIRNLVQLLAAGSYDGQPITNASITQLRYEDGAFHAVRVAVDPQEW